MVYNLKCTDTFDDSITIEDYKEDEIQVLNECDQEEMVEILMDAGQKIYEINEEQMDEIGFTEYGNPIMFASPILSTGILMYNQTTSAVRNNSMSEVEKSTFNARFEQYEGNQRGTAVRTLLQQVLSNNLTQDDNDRKIEISGDVEMGKNDRQSPTTDIKSGSTYEVELKYDNGYVSEIIITEN